MQPIIIADSHQDLLRMPLAISFATIMPDGFPQISLVWRLWEPPHILVSCPKNSQKAQNVARNPHVSLLAVDPHDDFRYLEIRGIVEDILDDPEYIVLDRVAYFYLNKPYYGGVEPVEEKGLLEHVALRIVPQKVTIVRYERLSP